MARHYPTVKAHPWIGGIVGVALGLGFAGCADAATSPSATTRHLTRAQVISAITNVLGERPEQTTIGGGGRPAAVALWLLAGPNRHYDLTVIIFREPALEASTWRQRPAYERSGYAMAKIGNVIVLPSLPRSQLGRNRPSFAMPPAAL
jgi:hypothetical protein